ncbi:unnamed protein product [Prorocentrum cordatum]|uniref:Uncharacterized protein n=1 Tax=Prorocentrum cordatum TaxID=2364126 RepID=A0ABN9PUV7_9DINO|nr:unnamed protein product [Polarella glacialis]
MAVLMTTSLAGGIPSACEFVLGVALPVVNVGPAAITTGRFPPRFCDVPPGILSGQVTSDTVRSAFKFDSPPSPGNVWTELQSLASVYSALEYGCGFHALVAYAQSWARYQEWGGDSTFPMVILNQWVVNMPYETLCTTAGAWRQIFVSPSATFWNTGLPDTTQAGRLIFPLPLGEHLSGNNPSRPYGGADSIPNATWTLGRILALITVISLAGQFPIIWCGACTALLATHAIGANGVVGRRIRGLPRARILAADFEWVAAWLSGGAVAMGNLHLSYALTLEMTALPQAGIPLAPHRRRVHACGNASRRLDQPEAPWVHDREEANLRAFTAYMGKLCAEVWRRAGNWQALLPNGLDNPRRLRNASPGDADRGVMRQAILDAAEHIVAWEQTSSDHNTYHGFVPISILDEMFTVPAAMRDWGNWTQGRFIAGQWVSANDLIIWANVLGWTADDERDRFSEYWAEPGRVWFSGEQPAGHATAHVGLFSSSIALAEHLAPDPGDQWPAQANMWTHNGRRSPWAGSSAAVWYAELMTGRDSSHLPVTSVRSWGQGRSGCSMGEWRGRPRPPGLPARTPPSHGPGSSARRGGPHGNMPAGGPCLGLDGARSCELGRPDGAQR